MPSSLDTGYTYYSNLLLACDFEEATGDVYDLVSETSIGTLQTNASRVTDGTWGETISSTGSSPSGVNFSDNPSGGQSQITIFVFQKFDTTTNDSTRSLVQKTGGGNDEIRFEWQANENLYGGLYQGASFYGDAVGGLDTPGTVAPDSWHAIALTWDGSTIYTWATDGSNTVKSSGQSLSGGTTNDTAHDLLLHYQANGDVAFFYMFDTALSQSDLEALATDPTLPIASAAGGLSIPLAIHHLRNQNAA